MLNFVFLLLVSLGTESGLVLIKTDSNHAEAVARLESIIEANPNLSLVKKVEHHKAAQANDLELQPSTLFIFGSPKLGTPLMQENLQSGIDLPIKILIYEKNGETFVSYTDPSYLQDRHQLSSEASKNILQKMSGSLSKIASSL